MEIGGTPGCFSHSGPDAISLGRRKLLRWEIAGEHLNLINSCVSTWASDLGSYLYSPHLIDLGNHHVTVV